MQRVGDSSSSTTFSEATKAEFLRHAYEHPASRRVPENERIAIAQWLSNAGRKPQSQEEYSRRHYVRRTFTLGEHDTVLLAKAKSEDENDRPVVTVESIADVVAAVHNANDHAGWDRTWKDVSASFYGILRADVIFLLRRCQTCSSDPKKRPKGSAVARRTYDTESGELFDLLHEGVWIDGHTKDI